MSLAKSIQKKALPGTWARGLQLHRSGAVARDNETDFRVRVPGRAVAYRVQLWPADAPDEDPDWHCECEGPLEVCEHVAACACELNTPTQARPSTTGWVRYEFRPDGQGLKLHRSIEYPGGEHREFPEHGMSLVALVGGITSGRVAWPPVSATTDDLALDPLLAAPRLDWPRILNRLARVGPHVFVAAPETAPAVTAVVDPRPLGPIWVIEDHAGGFRLRQEEIGAGTPSSSSGGPGLVRIGNTLRPWRSLTPSPPRVFRSREEIAHLVEDLLPTLTAEGLELRTDHLPDVVLAEPRIFLNLEADTEMRVSARIGYEENEGASPDGGWRAGVWREDPAAEKALARRLQLEFHLAVGRYTLFSPTEALAFTSRVAEVARAEPALWRLQGEGLRKFSRAPMLVPTLRADREGLHAGFASGGPAGTNGASGASVSAASVLSAWRGGASFVALEGGGFAPLPMDWLKRYGATLQRLLLVRAHTAPAAQPELAAFCEELGVQAPAEWARLAAELAADSYRSGTAGFETGDSHRSDEKGASSTKLGFPARLPPDLPATIQLRPYQLVGLGWLQTRRRQGIGALLADDMGLGKTLQAMCTLEPTDRALVICPKSVMVAWREQLVKFRPGLTVREYQGPERALVEGPGVTLTTYPILRLDTDLLAARDWDSVILDESQMIKNPSSQVARAARRLQAPHRIALTGTPVENRVDDLWSQMAFLNPGYLGDAAAIKTDSASLRILAARVRPFILRRTKREVAPELPPRTEVVLDVELSPSERELYEALRQAARKELAEKLADSEGQGTAPLSAFQALEVLLRLRQACCDPALVPGAVPAALPPPGGGPSSATESTKVRMLAESLEAALAEGHRALVFSQWTSMLDRIEPALRARGIQFDRLDGSTKDRGAVVTRFQAAEGPPVLLLSLKAGGVGLTLTAADHVYIMDPWWNPAAEDQAADRAHRIGQTNPVLIHRLVASGTVEARVLEMQRHKLALARALLGAEGAEAGDASTAFTSSEMLDLLAE